MLGKFELVISQSIFKLRRSSSTSVLLLGISSSLAKYKEQTKKTKDNYFLTPNRQYLRFCTALCVHWTTILLVLFPAAIFFVTVYHNNYRQHYTAPPSTSRYGWFGNSRHDCFSLLHLYSSQKRALDSHLLVQTTIVAYYADGVDICQAYFMPSIISAFAGIFSLPYIFMLLFMASTSFSSNPASCE